MAYLSFACMSAACVAAAYYFINARSHRSLARANGCQPPKKYPYKDPFLGLDLFFEAGKLITENRYLPELSRRYHSLGRTFEINTFGTPSINTIEPENLKTVYSPRFKDWGVQPVRLPAQEPFCGRGFITTDGPMWEHSRALLKPSFNRANMTDLRAFETYL